MYLNSLISSYCTLTQTIDILFTVLSRFHYNFACTFVKTGHVLPTLSLSEPTLTQNDCVEKKTRFRVKIEEELIKQSQLNKNIASLVAFTEKIFPLKISICFIFIFFIAFIFGINV